MGAAEGNIIAAIITTQTPRKKPKEPGSVFGPASIPRMRAIVTAQPTAATPPSSASSQSSNRRPLFASAHMAQTAQDEQDISHERLSKYEPSSRQLTVAS